MKKSSLYMYIALLAVNVLVMLGIFVLGEDKLPSVVFYGGLAYVMITTPLYLYLQLKSVTNYYKSLNDDHKQ